ncbi:MAG: peptidase M61, partial [Gallionellaceae bacterium]|nr:peptidase M61 [Gallionellaceae bacterium]
VSLGTLVDSTLLAGRYLRRLVLDESSRPVSLVVAADSPEALSVTPETEAQLRKLVREADALFGARHFRRYVFLVALSDLVSHFGLEAHESSENRIPENSFTNPAVGMLALAVLPHEYVHSWNGKYRRPAGLATPDFQTPMQGDLLWVYEGLTQYLGHVLAARSGLWTTERYRDRLAHVAAYYSQQPGRLWRPLADTAVSAQLMVRASPLWRSYRRSADYYSEGALVWLEADMLIRRETRGRRSLDDFCKVFFGGTDHDESGPPTVSPYTDAQLFDALNTVLPQDWRRFFADRIAATNPPAPVAGITLGGWRVDFSATRNPFLLDIETHDPSGTIDLAYSLGMRLTRDGQIDDLFPGSPADAVGLAPGMQLRAVNGRRWSASRLREALAAAQNSATGDLALLVENGDRFETVDLRYAGGLREPRLERLPSGPDRLGASIAPRTR